MLRARVGQHPGRWKPAYADFVKVWLATVLVFVVAVVVMLVLGSFLVMGGGLAALGASLVVSPNENYLWFVLLILVILVLFFIFMIVASLPARAYREARMFQLIWNHIGIGQIARFKTQLRTWPFVWLRVKNMLLTLLTLGFYRPFARVSEYRTKVNSVTIHIKGGTDQLVGQIVKQQGSLGDAAADALGLDIIG